MVIYNKFILFIYKCLAFNFFVVVFKGSFTSNFKTVRKKKFSMEQLKSIPICYYVNKKIIFQLINKSLLFNLITI